MVHLWTWAPGKHRINFPGCINYGSSAVRPPDAFNALKATERNGHGPCKRNGIQVIVEDILLRFTVDTIFISSLRCNLF